MSASPCELLPWDSEFFGARIARITGGQLTPDLLASVERWCEQQRIDCLYFLADTRDEAAEQWLRSRGFAPLDTRLTLEAPLPAAGRVAGDVREAQVSDISALRQIAAASHHTTRFYADARLAGCADALYALWIENSVRDPAVHVLVPDISPVAGYISCYETAGGVGQIGLLGVAASARGAGHGRRLVTAALDWMKERGLTRARVVTQGDNDAARRVYASCGFAPAAVQWWYHRWLTERSAR